MRFVGFCDRCNQQTEFPSWRVRVCHACECGMNSLAAMFDPPWVRPMTASEIRLADSWLRIERGGAAA